MMIIYKYLIIKGAKFMELGLKDKVVVITGGSQGIGKAAALEYLKEGCKVCVCARRTEVLAATKAEFAELGFELFTKTVDVTKYDEVEAFGQDIVDTYGRIDVWVNNAGANKYKMLLDYDVEDFLNLTNINLVSVFSGSKVAALHMKETGGGVILNASSYSAITPLAGKGPYAACKSGLLTLTKSFASELAPYNIRSLAYIPGMILTEISRPNVEKFGDALLRDIPSHRFGEPEDLAKALVFLSSDLAAGYINGVSLEISGAKRCTQNPWYPYEYLEEQNQ